MMGKRVYFFGGKGGVGKTTLSSAFSLILAKTKKVLLISTDPAHSLSDLFGSEVGPEAKEVEENLWAVEIDPKKQIEVYIKGAIEAIEGSVSPEVFEQIKEMFHSVEHTPGVEEAAILDALSRIVLKGPFEAFVVDTAPLGHALAMFRTAGRVGRWLEELIKRKSSAESFREKAGLGRLSRTLEILRERRERFSRFLEVVIRDSLFFPVLNPEKLSIVETERMVEEVTGLGIEITHLFVNKVMPKDVKGEFVERRRSQEKIYMDLIRERFGSFKIVTVEMRPRDVVGMEDLKELAKELEGKL